MKFLLPNSDRAVVEIAKLQGYCLKKEHARGRHKARVFESALGLRSEDAEILRQAILDAARREEATLGGEDQYGARYLLDFEMSGPSGRAWVRSIRIVLRSETFPRLTSCYVL